MVPRFQEWWHEDHKDKRAGGRPRFLNDHHILAVSLLLLREGSPLWVTEMGRVFWNRLDDEGKKLLGIDHHRNTGDDNVDRERWRSRAYEAYERLLVNIDAWPQPKKLMALEERKQVVSARDQNESRRKTERGREFANAMMEMTIQMLPRRIRRQLSNAVSLDQTAVRAVSPRSRFSRDKTTGEEVAPPNTTHHGLVSEIDADLYPTKAYTNRSRKAAADLLNGLITDAARKAAQKPRKGDFIWAFMLNLTVMVPPNAAAHPTLAVALSLSKPNEGIAEEGLSAASSLVKRGYKLTRMTTDLGYAHLKGYAAGLQELGVPRLSDYKINQLGVHGGVGGSKQIEGHHYCAALPEHLRDATIALREGKITLDEYRQLIQERLKFRLRRKESPDANGRFPMVCPAYGPQATVKCKLRPEHANEAKNQPVVEESDLPAIPDRICTKSSVAFGVEDGVEYSNAIDYGTEKWKAAYTDDRNAVESFNNAEKNERHAIDIDDPFSRRKRGRAAAFFALTMMTVEINIGRILRFLRDEDLRIKAVAAKKIERSRDRLGISEYAHRKGKAPRVETDPIEIPDSDVPYLT